MAADEEVKMAALEVVMPKKLCVFETRLGQICAGEVGTMQYRLAEIGPPEIGFPQIHATQIRLC